MAGKKSAKVSNPATSYLVSAWRRCVEIALAEFGGMSSRAVAQMCGVSHTTVQRMMPEPLEQSSNATRTTSDGRQYPAQRRQVEERTEAYQNRVARSTRNFNRRLRRMPRDGRSWFGTGVRAAGCWGPLWG
jgi:hypothetical protein